MNKQRWSLAFVAVMMVMLLSMTLWATQEKKDTLKTGYERLNKEYAEKMKKIKSRDAYRNLLQEHKKALEGILAKLGDQTLDDPLTLLKGKVLFDLKRGVEAIKIFEALIQKKSPVANEAKFEKTRLMIMGKRYDPAMQLFREVEKNVKKSRDYFWVLFELAFSATDVKDRLEFSQKFIDGVKGQPEYEGFKSMIYSNLSRIEQEKGNVKKAIEIIEKAIPEFTTESPKRELQAALKQMKMLGQPAPEISATKWINSSAVKLADLKGKAVILDFWAPWCRPCRRVIPVLAKNYDLYKDKGLVVIGFTRIFGYYSDDLGNKGKVPAEEERKLIDGFGKRNKISYPIAVDDSRVIFDAYSVMGLPTMVLINKSGKIEAIEVGSGDEKALEEKIKKLLD